MTGPLDGYRVLELTTTVSGPMAAMTLADQGAEVVKIEPPLFGDTARYLGSQREGVGSLFAVLNRNKKSVSLDLKSDREKEIFLSLVDSADALIENYRPGVMDRMGLGWEVLSKRNPGLVYAAITGYGPDGPYQNRRVYDPLIQATTGIAAHQGETEPQLVQMIIFDKVTALTTAQAVTAALPQRGETGRGQYLPISMLDSALSFNWPDVMWSRTLQGDGIRHNGELADYFQIFDAKDGQVQIILITEELLELLCVWRGSELHKDPRFANLPARLERAEEFRAAINALLADVTVQEVCEALDSFGVPVAALNTLDDLHEDEQIRHRGSLVETDHPQGGAMRMARPPVEFDGQEVRSGRFPERHSPAIGADTRSVLEALGVPANEIAEFEERDRKNAANLRAVMSAAAQKAPM